MTSQARHRSVPLADNDPIERWKHPSADVTLLHPIRRLQTASKSVQADPQLLRRFLATTQRSSPPPTLSDGVRPPDGFGFSRFCLASQTEGLGRARLQVLAPGPSWTLLDQIWVPRPSSIRSWFLTSFWFLVPPGLFWTRFWFPTRFRFWSLLDLWAPAAGASWRTWNHTQLISGQLTHQRRKLAMLPQVATTESHRDRCWDPRCPMASHACGGAAGHVIGQQLCCRRGLLGLIFTLLNRRCFVGEQLTASRYRCHGTHLSSCLSTDPVTETCPLIR